MFPFKPFVQTHVANITVKRFVLVYTIQDKKHKRFWKIDRFSSVYVKETLTEPLNPYVSNSSLLFLLQRSINFQCYHIKFARPNHIKFCVLTESTSKVGHRRNSLKMVITEYLLLSVITYRQIPHLSQWKGFFSTPVKCLHMKQKYADICSPQPLQYWLPSLI